MNKAHLQCSIQSATKARCLMNPAHKYMQGAVYSHPNFLFSYFLHITELSRQC